MPRPKPGLHSQMSMLSILWDMTDVVHDDLLEPEGTIIAYVYCEQLDRVNVSIMSSFVKQKYVILQWDN